MAEDESGKQEITADVTAFTAGAEAYLTKDVMWLPGTPNCGDTINDGACQSYWLDRRGPVQASGATRLPASLDILVRATSKL